MSVPFSLSNFRRRQFTVGSTIDLPLSRMGDDLGRLSLNVHAEVERLSDFGALWTYGIGLTWAPARYASFSGSVHHQDGAPSPHELTAPSSSTPNYQIYDFVRDETAYVTLIEGGNPNLPRNNQQTFKLGTSIRPFEKPNLTIIIDYARTRNRSRAGYLPGLTPEFEAAFPEKFIRDESGRLIAIDARPVAFSRVAKDQIRWGASWSHALVPNPAPIFSQPGGPLLASDVKKITAAAGGESGRVQLALYHTYRLKDEVAISAEAPLIDYLHGSLAGSSGGRARHQLELQASIYEGGVGASITGNMQSGTTVLVGGEDGSAEKISYSSVKRIDLRLFANVEDVAPFGAKSRFFEGLRTTLEVGNLLNDRPRARNSAGETPHGLQPAYLDPLGRTIKLSLRKSF